jgi:cytochrome c
MEGCMYVRFTGVALAFAALLAALCDLVAAQTSPSARGEAIAQKHCARCHAIGDAGASPMGLAPPFRDLSKRYPIETLAEALAEGIVVGHPAMPRFTFEPREIDALLSYMSGLKATEPARR